MPRSRSRILKAAGYPRTFRPREFPSEAFMSDKRKPLKKKQVKEKSSVVPVDAKPLGESVKKSAAGSKKS
jgi:hypothetical protein